MSEFFADAQASQLHWPQTWPAGGMLRRYAKRPYRVGTSSRPYKPTTEEYPRYATKSPLRLRHISNYGGAIGEVFGPQGEVAIAEDGSVYTGGYVNYPDSPGADGNPFGSGPDFRSELPARVRSTTFRSYLRKPYNPLASFRESRFLKCCIIPVPTSSGKTAVVSYLLDDRGSLWVSGHPYLAGTEDVGVCPDYPTGAVPYYTPRAVASYVTPSGAEASQSELVFSDISASTADGTSSLNDFYGFFALAVTTSGKMLSRCDRISSRLGGKWYEVSGFLDSVNVISGGSGYGSGTTVTVSAPDNPNGVRATVAPVIQQGAITAVRIYEPGWGYLSSPSLTINTSEAPQQAAQLQANLFSGKWEKVFSFGSKAAALTDGGALYVWGNGIPTNRPTVNVPDDCLSPRVPIGAYAAGYKDVVFTNGFAAVRNDGNVDFARVDPRTGSLASWLLQTYSPPEMIVGCAGATGQTIFTTPVIYLLSHSGVVYGYYAGAASSITPIESQSRFSRIFSGMQTVSANRIEDFDEYGNPLSPLPTISDGFG